MRRDVPPGRGALRLAVRLPRSKRRGPGRVSLDGTVRGCALLPVGSPDKEDGAEAGAGAGDGFITVVWLVGL